MPDKSWTITDSHVLAAMSHPARRRLLDALAVDGPSTVSMLAERTDLAIGSASHHLKVLSQARLVEDATELARDRREHWWRVASSSLRWSTSTFDDDPVAAAVADAASSLNLEHHVSKVRAWRARTDEPAEAWQDAAFATDTWLRLTPTELRALGQELNELVDRWHTRGVPDDGAQREDVFVFAHGIPAAP
jgi:DNA-binding transcriptional ArsR family regulator